MSTTTIIRPTFTRLSSDVSFLKGAEGVASSVGAPELIVLLTWMDAKLLHINKYIDGYLQLYPTSSILLIRSHQLSFYKGEHSTRIPLSPAAALIKAHSDADATKTSSGKKSSILVHVFSNGGCFGLGVLNDLLKGSGTGSEGGRGSGKRLIEKEGIPARAFIFDSCPGKTSLPITLRAFTAPIKSWWLKYPAYVLVTVFYTAIRFVEIIQGLAPRLDRLALHLNAPSVLPPVPRLYLYSPLDALIPPQNVEGHALTARSNGIEVTLEKFEKSQHVAHARSEPERYWKAVKEHWERSGR